MRILFYNPDNRRVIYKLVKGAAGQWRKAWRKMADASVEARAL